MKNEVLPSKRSQIIVKGYGGIFGRAQIIISLIPNLVARFPEITFFIYSVTDDVLKLINDLSHDIRAKIIIHQVSNPVPHEKLLEEFSKSRIYIGCSISDGISTSFLESLICGSYPIQTNTSCANEWIELGAVASIIPLNSEILLNEVLKSLSDDAYVNVAAIENRKIAERYLSKEVIKLKAAEFYRV
jgi:glycosyltransferase involved in cell wall biosynthesis